MDLKLNTVDLDEMDSFDQLIDPAQRRSQPANPWKGSVKRKHWTRVEEMTERPEREDAGGFFLSKGLDTTNEERAFVEEQLRPFYDLKLIHGVLRRVKGGKEANVYCCQAHPATGVELLAAKVYRPRQLRNLKNDSQYRQGRPVLNGDGQALDTRDWRAFKAIAGKSRFGLRLTQTSWVEYEFQTLKKLYAAGADVPKPYHNSTHVMLMDYIGELESAAPTLHKVALEAHEAQPMFERLMHNVELMLQQHCIHGDLSAYNVMYWEGDIKLIDFPQIVDPRYNPDAQAIFTRDVTRLCDYFARYGIRTNPARLAHEMWKRYAPPPAALEL